MKELDQSLLKPYAKKYVWWKSPEEAIQFPARIIAQVMNIGDYDDVQNLLNQVGEESLRDVIQNAEAGQFSEKSWFYWHYRLRLAQYDKVPSLPVRKVE